MSKNDRRDKIVEYITNNEVNKQEEIVEYLNSNGFDVTQATVSRDIKILGLIKVKGVNKNSKYSMPNVLEERTLVTEEKLLTLLKTFIISIHQAKNLIVIKTLEGNGSSCGMAIDKLKLEEIIGSIAGDDSLLIITDNDEDATKVVKYIKGIL